MGEPMRRVPMRVGTTLELGKQFLAYRPDEDNHRGGFAPHRPDPKPHPGRRSLMCSPGLVSRA